MVGKDAQNAYRGEEMNNQHIQLQQKVIHYRSEVAKYKQLLQLVETELKREQLRNHYLQKQLEQMDECEQTIEKLEQQLLFYEVALEQEKKRKKEEKKESAHAYFAYATMIPEEKDEHVTVIGDLIIENSGNTPLNDPIICLRLRPPDHAQLSGKFSFRQLQEEGGWTFAVDNWRQKIKEGEYWLKPIDETTLLPNEQLRFPSFELRVIQTVVVEGFVYFRQLKQGVSSFNHIVINK